MADFFTETQGHRWRAFFQGDASIDTATLEYPSDMLQNPGPFQVAGIDSVKIVMTTDATVANRRPRLRLRDSAGHDVVTWFAGVVTPASATDAIYEFVRPFGGADVLVGTTARCALPDCFWMLEGWSLIVDIIGVQANDFISNIIVTGEFRG